MSKLQVEESNKNREAIIADNALRNLPEEEVIKVLRWWDRFRGGVGWRRLSKVMTAYAKEFRAPYQKEDIIDDDKEYDPADFEPELYQRTTIKSDDLAIHHIDGNPTNNSRPNLIITKPSYNRRIIKHDSRK